MRGNEVLCNISNVWELGNNVSPHIIPLPWTYMYYDPYARASQHFFNENIYTNLYIFLIIMTYSITGFPQTSGDEIP